MATRRESVVLTLEDNFSTGMARAAVMTAALSKELRNLDGTKVDRTLSDTDRAAKEFGESLEGATKSSDNLGRSNKKTSAEIDKLSGRLRLAIDSALLFGPALAPIGALAVPAVAGLASELGVAALAGGTAVLAFQGVGETLKAVNTAALEPTTQNLAAAQAAMEQLSPAAQSLVTQLEKLQPTLKGLESASAQGLFPGVSAAIDELATAAPEVERVLGSIGTVLGNLAKEGADALTGPGFSSFFDYIAREAPAALAQLGTAVGHVTHGLAELVTAAAPLSASFGNGLAEAAKGFDSFASGVAKTQGFQEFVAYLKQNGPLVGQAVEAISNALLQVVEAASGFGGPVLQSVTAVANVIAKLADSDAGPAIFATASALALLNRTMAVGNAVKGSALFTNLGKAKTAAADVEGLGGKVVAVTKVLGPYGAALGIAGGVLLHFAGGQHQAVVDTGALTGTLNQQTGAITQNTAAYVAQQFATKGILETAQQLGLSLSDVTDAALGNQAALARVNGALSQYTTQQTAATTAGRGASVTGVGNNQALADSAKKIGDAINGTSGALADGRSKLALISAATKGATGSFNAATSAAQSFGQQMTSLNDLLEGRASLRDYQAALDDFAKSIKDNGKSLDITTEKGRANQAALDNIAASASKVAQSLQGADRQDFLIKARASFLDAAKKADIGRQAAVELANSIYNVGQQKATPKILLDASDADRGLSNVHVGLSTLDKMTATPKVNAQTGQAQAAIDGVLHALGLLRDKTVIVTTVTHTRAGGLNPQASADGGEILGQRHPYGDKVLIHAAPGEQIISNRFGQADQFRADRAAGRIPSYANGGTVGRSSAPYLDVTGIPADLTHNMYDLTTALKRLDASLNRQLKVQQKALDQEQKKDDSAHSTLDAVTGQRDSLSSTISGTFGLDNIFAKSPASANPWAAGATAGGKVDPTSALNKITASANQFLADVKTLQQDGVSGAALQAIISQGADVTHQLAQGSIADLSAYSQAYGAATTAVSAASSYGADSIYGRQVAHDQAIADRHDAILREMKQQIKDLTGAVKTADANAQAASKENSKDTTAGVNGAASKGKRNRVYAQHRN